MGSHFEAGEQPSTVEPAVILADMSAWRITLPPELAELAPRLHELLEWVYT